MNRIVASRFCLFLWFAFAQSVYGQELPDPERFEDAIRRFEVLDRENPPPDGAIVLTGSSSIARWNDQAAQALTP
ncbi:MAG: hypothetical protein OXI74_04315, partial [Rhodospirillaceae bacterium]|nr:hypothetical protein [Rhodospirillaceae bacterium]